MSPQTSTPASAFKQVPRSRPTSPHHATLTGPDGCVMPQSIGLSVEQLEGPHGIVSVLRIADKEPTSADVLVHVVSQTARPTADLYPGLFNVSVLPQILLATYVAGMVNHQQPSQAACLTAFVNVIRYRVTLLLDLRICDKKLNEDLNHVLSVCDDPRYLDTVLVLNVNGQPLPSPKTRQRALLTVNPERRVVVEDGERFRNSGRCKFWKHCRAQGWANHDLTAHLHSFAMTLHRLFCVLGLHPQEFLCFETAVMAGSCPDETVQWVSLIVDTIVELRLTHRVYQIFQARRLCGDAKEALEVFPGYREPGIRESRCAEDVLTSVLVREIRKRAVTI